MGPRADGWSFIDRYCGAGIHEDGFAGSDHRGDSGFA
jgi:hypothetical protein